MMATKSGRLLRDQASTCVSMDDVFLFADQGTDRGKAGVVMVYVNLVHVCV